VPHHVEQVVHDCGRGRAVVLQSIERRAAFLIEGDNLTIDHGVARKPRERPYDAWISDVEVVVVPIAMDGAIPLESNGAASRSSESARKPG
jgi:hypothetical protein